MDPVTHIVVSIPIFTLCYDNPKHYDNFIMLFLISITFVLKKKKYQIRYWKPNQCLIVVNSKLKVSPCQVLYDILE